MRSHFNNLSVIDEVTERFTLDTKKGGSSLAGSAPDHNSVPSVYTASAYKSSQNLQSAASIQEEEVESIATESPPQNKTLDQARISGIRSFLHKSSADQIRLYLELKEQNERFLLAKPDVLFSYLARQISLAFLFIPIGGE